MPGPFDQVLNKVQGAQHPELGRGGYLGLRDILMKYFLPELERQQGKRGGIEGAFLGQVTEPGALYGAASEAASGTARKLFEPGGEVANLIARARGRSVQSGFAPEAAEGAERNILGAATRRVADTFAEQAGALEQTRFGALAGTYGAQEQSIRDLLESLFTGVASAEQYGLARKPPRSKFLGLF